MLADRQVNDKLWGEAMSSRFADEDIARLRIALARISRVVDRKASEDGFTRTQLSVLATVARLESVGISELADIEGLNPTMLSRLIGKLETEGLVRRIPGIEDRRAVQVEISDAGHARSLRLRKLRTQVFAEQLTKLPDGRAFELLAALPALEALAAQMRGPVPETVMASEAIR